MRQILHELPDGDWCPNSALPLIIYRDALRADSTESLARRFEETFDRNGWPPAWRYTIYDFPHFHSTSHEVIGVYRGFAVVRFGDEAGISAELNVGDVVLIPAGVSHQRLSGSPDFHGVGAYPAGCEVDQLRPGGSDRPASDRRIASLPVPEKDPLLGAGAGLAKEWKRRGPHAGGSGSIS